MDLDRYREYPVVGDLIFREPREGWYDWAFFVFAVLVTAGLVVDRGAKVALLAGGGLILLSVPNVLPERYYRASVVFRLVAILYNIALWVAISVYFPDAPTFFEGDW